GNAGMNGMDLSFQYVDDPYNIDNYPSVLHFDLALADTTLDVMTFDPISVYMHDDDTSGYDYYYFDAVYGEGLDSFSMSLHFISPPSSDLAVQVLPDEQLDLGAGKGNAIEILLPQSETAPDDLIISGIPAVDRNMEGLHYGYVHFIFLSDDPKYSDTTGFQELIQITDSRVVDLMRDDAEVLHIQNTTDGTYIITGLDQEHTYAVEVFTLSGALLFSGIGSNSNSYAIESVAWSPGMYMVRLTDTDSNAIKTGRILFH
ncbi:MAG: T9SS type A sorting domain-containing protein, partial [Chitinophagales bacterium]